MTSSQVPREGISRLLDLYKDEQGRALAFLAVRQSLITPEQLDQAFSLSTAQKQPVADILVSQGWVERGVVNELLSTLAREEMIRAVVTDSSLTDMPAEVLPYASDLSRHLAEYVMVTRLGAGGAGDVWKAWDRQLHRWVALKIPATVLDTREKRERFRIEALAAARLSHPNIVATYRVAEDQGRPYIVMQLVEGRSLEEMKLPLDRAIDIMAQVCTAVHYAHEHGVIHRDIKPGNIMMDDAGKPWILDFGLAFVLEENKSLTTTGQVFGTPEYMSPEQVNADTATSRAPTTDVYALGATLYEVVCGRPPFVAEKIADVMRRVVEEDPPRPRMIKPTVPKEIETIILKALAKEPSRRYQTAGQMADDLRRFLQDEPIQASPPSLLYIARRKISKHRIFFGTAATACFIIAGILIALVPQWLHERRQREERELQLKQQEEQARQREVSLQELDALWTALVLEKQGWYIPSRDPAETRGRILSVLSRLDAFIVSHPNIPKSYYVRATGRFYVHQIKEAQRDLETLIKDQPDFAPAWALLGRLKISENEGTLFFNLQGSQIRDQRISEIKEYFAKGWKKGEGAAKWGLLKLREEEVAEILAHALQMHYVDKNEQGSIALLKQAHAKAPSEEYARFLALWTPDSMTWLTEALRCMPHFAEAYFTRGTMRLRMGQWDGSLSDLSEAVRIDPTYVDAFYNRGCLHMSRGGNAQALSDFARTLELNPAYTAASINTAEIQREAKNFKEAAAALNQAIQYVPTSCNLFLRRGFVYELWADHQTGADRKATLANAERDYKEGLKHRGDGDSSVKDIEFWIQRVQYKLAQ